MLPWAVRELSTGAIVGSTRYHDIVPEIDRVEWTGLDTARERLVKGQRPAVDALEKHLAEAAAG